MDEHERSDAGRGHDLATAALAGVAQLCGILAQRHIIDASDLATIHDIMHHVLRPIDGKDLHGDARTLLASWFVRAHDLAPESMPLPEKE